MYQEILLEYDTPGVSVQKQQNNHPHLFQLLR